MGTLSDAVQEITQGTAAVNESELWQAGEAELAAALRDIEIQTRRLGFAQLKIMRELDSRGTTIDRGEGQRTTVTGLLRDDLNLSPAQTRARLDAAHDLLPGATFAGDPKPTPLPNTAAAAADGAITDAHVRIISKLMGFLPDTLDVKLRKWTEWFMADQSRKLDELDIRRLASQIRKQYAPPGPDDIEHRTFSVTPGDDGRYKPHGEFDDEAAATINAAINTLSKPEPADEFGNKDMRSAGRRRADALVELCRRFLDSGTLPASGGERPHIALTMTLDQLRAAASEALGHEVQITDPSRAPVPTTDGHYLDPATARRVACDAAIIPVVLGSAGEPLDVGRSQRLFPASIRRALVVRDKGCAWPGCHRPPEWCDGHHITPWSAGGKTSLDSGVLLCGRHHRIIHRGDYEIRMIDGHPHVIPPAWRDPEQKPRRNYYHHLAPPQPGDP
jgi:hypothetical protein